jgi:hypothetical protein
VVIVSLSVAPAEAQLSGRVVLREGPIAVDVVFGPRYEPTRRYRPVRRAAPAPVRYRVGMSLWELDRYFERIDLEYDLFRRMDPRDAFYDYGWTRHQLRDYVRFLRNERSFLRAERERLYRLHRAGQYRIERPGRGQGRGRGRGLALGRRGR